MGTRALVILGLLSAFVGLLLRLIVPGLRYYAWGIVALGAGLLAGAIVSDFRRVRHALVSRRGQVGLSSAVKLSLAGGIILLVNAIGVGSNHRFDFTGLAQFTLTSQTREVLADLDRQVEVVSFFSPDMPVAITTYAESLLEEYQIHTDQITVRNVDPDLNPDQAREHHVDQFGALYGVVVFRSDGGQRHVYGPQIASEAEHAFTSAVLEVTGIKQKKVYFLTGHGESGIHAEYDRARIGLRDSLFEVSELDLLKTPSIPEDASALVLAGPRQPLSESELELLTEYLDQKGRLMVLLNPGSDAGLNQLLDRWALEFGEGTMIDPSSHVAPDPDTPLVPRTRNVFGLGQVFFPGTAAVIRREEIPAHLTVGALAWSGPESWLEREFRSGEPARFDENIDGKGPLAIGVTVAEVVAEESQDVGTRLVVIGDSDFAANTHFPSGDNAALFLNSINWLTEGEEIVSVDRKVLPVRRLILNPEQTRFLHISSIGLLPFLLLVVAGYMWWRRR